MTDRPVRAILDASAIVRYVRGGDPAIHVGEVLTEVADDGVAALPVLCMAQALRAVGDGYGDQFRLLTEHAACVLEVGPRDWQLVAGAVDLVGTWDAAVAVVLAIDLMVAVLTAEPETYAGFADPTLTITV